MGEIVGGYEDGKVGSELAVVVVLVSLYRHLFDPPVHLLGLAIGPWVEFGPAVQGPARYCPRINGGQFRALTGHVEGQSALNMLCYDYGAAPRTGCRYPLLVRATRMGVPRV